MQQWRKARSGSNGESAVAVLTRPTEPATSPAPEEIPAAPEPHANPQPQRGGGPSLLARLIASLRRLFDGSMIMPLDPKPDATPSPAPAEPAVEAPVRMQLVRVAPEPVAELVPALEPEPVAAMAPAPEPVPAMAPSSPEPVAAVAPVPEPVAEAPRPAPAQPPVARPKRKRPNPPTNKDMLKQTLSVLKKVEERLGQLEHEVSVIDGAVRKVVSSSDESGEPAAVGE